MINMQNFIQAEVPTLYKVITINQSENDFSFEFWDHIVELFEFRLLVVNNSQNFCDENLIQLLFAKEKQGHLKIWKFLNSCLMFQKRIKIPYAVINEITAIKAFRVDFNSQKQPPERKQKNLPINLLVVGYFSGLTELFQIKTEQNQILLTSYLKIKSDNSQPVTNAVIYDNCSLYVCRLHSISFYLDIVTLLYKRISEKNKIEIRSSETILEVKEFKNSSKVSISLSDRNIHLFNQTQGLFSFSLPDMQSSRSVIDSVKSMVQTPEGDLIIASSDDCLKIIYTKSNEIQRLAGMKSFVSTIIVNEITESRLLQLWFSDMHGEIHYLIKKKARRGMRNAAEKQEFSDKNNQILVFEDELKQGLKITQNGIKKMLLTKNMLVVVDTLMAISVYDIIRSFHILPGRLTN